MGARKKNPVFLQHPIYRLGGEQMAWRKRGTYSYYYRRQNGKTAYYGRRELAQAISKLDLLLAAENAARRASEKSTGSNHKQTGEG